MITLVFTLIVIGVCLYLIETFIPLADPIRTVIRIVVVLFSILLILSAFGVVHTPVTLK